MRTPDPDELLTSAEAAKLLKVHQITLANWRRQGSGPRYVKLGNGPRGRVRYARRDISAYLKARSGK